MPEVITVHAVCFLQYIQLQQYCSLPIPVVSLQLINGGHARDGRCPAGFSASRGRSFQPLPSIPRCESSVKNRESRIRERSSRRIEDRLSQEVDRRKRSRACRQVARRRNVRSCSRTCRGLHTHPGTENNINPATTHKQQQ